MDTVITTLVHSKASLGLNSAKVTSSYNTHRFSFDIVSTLITTMMYELCKGDLYIADRIQERLCLIYHSKVENRRKMVLLHYGCQSKI